MVFINSSFLSLIIFVLPLKFHFLIDIKLLNGDNASSTQGLTEFQKHFAPYFKNSVLKMCSTDSIKLSDLPVSMLDRYSNRTRDKFMITIYPSGQLYADANVLYRFVDDMERITPKATGTPLVSVAWFQQ